MRSFYLCKVVGGMFSPPIKLTQSNLEYNYCISYELQLHYYLLFKRQDFLKIIKKLNKKRAQMQIIYLIVKYKLSFEMDAFGVG